jgi:two-component system phosphate regulon sensor histidine kinase PhoR
MFKANNFSPNQLSSLTAAIISLISGICFYLISKNFSTAALITLTIFFTSFFLIRYMLESFINNKIKLIYKLIYQTKATKKEEMYYKYILPKKGIDEAKDDVMEWAAQRKEEIEVLRSNEAYRKEFLQNLAHEFKTPIFAIQGYVDTLLNGALENPEVNVRFLEKTAQNVGRMVNLIHDLDEISNLESGSQPVSPRNFIIQDLIRETFESLSIKTSKRNIKCSIKKGCELPITVFADKEKIMQVLINLVENATKYGQENGNIIASVYKTDDTHVLVEISDDGIGIAEEHLNRIFERFYRTDRGRSRDVGGTGLGLSICKHIIEAHGQSIHARSKLDVGTTVGFLLETKAKD